MLIRRLISTLIYLLFLLPLFMYFAWWLAPKKKLVVAIVDKTVLNTDVQEHASLLWILNYYKFSKTAHHLYKSNRDYFGFFPTEGDHYRLKGLESASEAQLEKLSQDCDLAYYTDTYGVFKSEWYSQFISGDRSGIIYGGTQVQDIQFMSKMKAKKKLVITEFNTIATPTPDSVRYRFEKLYGVRWSGWIGRYFDSFDTSVNKGIPHWLVNNYLEQHNNSWPFKKSGIALVNKNDEIVILEKDTHLLSELPHLYSSRYGIEHYDLPPRLKYSFWFDIVSTSPVNKIVSLYKIEANLQGKKILADHGIPASFPAILEHKGPDYGFYYFAGDFSDNPISLRTSYYKGITLLKGFFYNEKETIERKSFFWKYYLPMVSTILNEYYSRLHPRY